jgi:F-type H+/Na+-transporting ATPase subunit beta
MDSTDGLRRGIRVKNLGRPISMPVGDQIRGRLLNVVGAPIDGMKEVDQKGGYPVHNKPPAFEDCRLKPRFFYRYKGH